MSARRLKLVPLALSKSRNMRGPLDERTRRRVLAAVNAPSEKTWDNAYTIIVGSDGWMTLWQAVIAVEPCFPSVGPSTTEDGSGRVLKRTGWATVPTSETLIRAIEHATSQPPRKAARS